MNFKTIKADEYQKFCDILTKHGFSNNDFELCEEPSRTKNLPDDTEPNGGISITYRQTHRNKTYPVAIGTPWTKTFENDLVAGFFDGD